MGRKYLLNAILPHTRCSGVRVLKAVFGVVLLLLFVAVPLVFALVRFYEVAVSDWQFVEVEVEVVDEKGLPAGPVHVAVFELADGGPKLLAEGRAGASGTFKFGLKVLRKLIVELEDGTRIYAPVNLWIIASRIATKFSRGRKSG